MTGHFRFSLRPVLLALPLLAGVSLSAQGTHLWTQSHLGELEKGTTRGVGISSEGRLFAAPGLIERLTTSSNFVWSMAVDKGGTAYLATGSPASVLRLAPGAAAKPFTLFESKEVSVQSLVLGPDGMLYAAMLPSGKVYRINPTAQEKLDEAKAPVIFDAAALAENKGKKESHYIWAMSFDAKGRLYIATGNPAGVVRVDLKETTPHVETFFSSDEAHIRSLAWDAAGNLIAGSEGSGLVYRIDSSGKGYVLFAAPRKEVAAVAVGSDGTIYAACVGEKGNPALAAQPLQAAGAQANALPLAQPHSLQMILAGATQTAGSDVYALAEEQAPRKLWSTKSEIVYALVPRADGLLALTGKRGRILRINADGSDSDLAHLDAQQGLTYATNGDALLIGTGNPGKLVSLGAATAHEYASTVLDAGALAHFGAVEIDPGSNGYRFFTRSGNVEQPVRGWSPWTPLKDGAVASPAGRYLQWKAELDSNGSLGSVGVNFLTINAAPVLDELVVVPGARLNESAAEPTAPKTVSIHFGEPEQHFNLPGGEVSAPPITATRDRTSVTARWAAHDDNGDRLRYALYLRGDGESLWRPLKDELTATAYSFDALRIPDGGYQLKVVATDAPSHAPGEALTAEKISRRFVIDTTAPVLTGLGARRNHGGLTVGFTAEDALSTLTRAEVSLDGGPWQTIEPVGKLFDRRRLVFSFPLPLKDEAPAEHLLTVRIADRAGNVALAKTVIPAEAK